jgi:Holliday junction resolvase RusA-like endonuclease
MIPKNAIFIPINTPSSKNSRVWTGKFFIKNKLSRMWEKDTATFWNIYQRQFVKSLPPSPPYHVKFYFVRDSKRKFDLINALQIVQDAMVKHHWIEDDNADILVPVFEGYHIDKPKAGVYIWI